MLAARPFGSALLAHLAATLTQWADGAEPAVAHAPSERLVYYAAHDTNLLYLAELLELKWLAKGWQPNHTPPGGMLAVEVLAPSNAANPSDQWQLSLFFDVQTPQQMRDLSSLSDATESTRPSRVPVTVPGCSARLSEGGPLLCPLPTFLQLVGRAVRAECITPAPLRAFAEGLGGGGAAARGISLLHAAMAVCSVAGAALCLGVVVGRLAQRRLRRREQRGKLGPLVPLTVTHLARGAARAQSVEAASAESSDSDSRPLVPP